MLYILNNNLDVLIDSCVILVKYMFANVSPTIISGIFRACDSIKI